MQRCIGQKDRRFTSPERAPQVVGARHARPLRGLCVAPLPALRTALAPPTPARLSGRHKVQGMKRVDAPLPAPCH